MRADLACGVVACLLSPAMVTAQPVSGVYLGAGAGGNFMQDELLSVYQAPPAGSPKSGRATAYQSSISMKPGAVALGSMGYGFGNGWRIELEAAGRYNALSHVPDGYEQKIGAMANVLYDLDVGSPYVFPYLGAGGGYMNVHRNAAGSPNSNEGAYQGIFGTAWPIPPVVGLSATLEYRFMGLTGSSATALANTPNPARVKYNRDDNHSALLGLRYAFDTAPPAAPPAAAPIAAPAPEATRTYLIFFDWDHADLTDRARSIVGEAAKNAARVQVTRIQVNGYTDLSGTEAYNQRLSVRRAQAVAAELVRDGVAKDAIAIEGFGERNPLVPTAAGVREPQNRRVEIIIR